MENELKLLRRLNNELAVHELAGLLRLLRLYTLGVFNRYQLDDLLPSVCRAKPKNVAFLRKHLFPNDSDKQKRQDPDDFAVFVHSNHVESAVSLSPSYKIVPASVRLPLSTHRVAAEERLFNNCVVSVSVGKEYKTAASECKLDNLLDSYTDQLAEIDIWRLRFANLRKAAQTNRPLSSVEKEVVYRLYKEHTKSVLDASEFVRPQTLSVVLQRVEAKDRELEAYREEVIIHFQQNLMRLSLGK